MLKLRYLDVDIAVTMSMEEDVSHRDVDEADVLGLGPLMRVRSVRSLLLRLFCMAARRGYSVRG